MQTNVAAAQLSSLPSNMAPHTSDDLRYRIIHWYHEYGLSAVDISTLAGCSVRTVFSVLAYFRDYHNIRNPFAHRRGRKRILTSTDIDFIASVIDARPKIFLDELQEDLAHYRGIDVSIVTLSRTLRRIAISKKKVSSSAAERNELLRAMWQAEYAHYPAEYFVWLDESSVDDFTNLRTEGWAAFGRACVSRETFIRGQRYSVLPALTTDGIVALDIFEGSVNKERFISFIQNNVVCAASICLPCDLCSFEQAPILNPFPGPRSVVVLDNCAIHHDREIRNIIEVECREFIIPR
jgi:transposase